MKCPVCHQITSGYSSHKFEVGEDVRAKQFITRTTIQCTCKSCGQSFAYVLEWVPNS